MSARGRLMFIAVVLVNRRRKFDFGCNATRPCLNRIVAMNLICRAVMLSSVIVIVFNLNLEARAQGNNASSCRFTTPLSATDVWNDPILGKSGPYDPGDYERRLDSDFMFTDCTGYKHVVPKGFVYNGVSIPRALWTIGGYTPHSGKVEGPGVVHDFLCDKVLFTSSRAHQVFWEGLTATGTPKIDAAIMYGAVKYFGPRWDRPGGPVSRPTFSQAIFDLIVKSIRQGANLVIESFDKREPGFVTDTIAKYQSYDLRPGTLNIEKTDEIDQLLSRIDLLPQSTVDDLNKSGKAIIRFDLGPAFPRPTVPQ